jgi:hypothetical protein
MYVDPIWQNVIFVAFGLTWLGMAFIFYMRFYLVQRVYLRHFAGQYPFLAGEPLFNAPRILSNLPLGMRLMRERQSEPQLEQLRRTMWQRYRFMALWVLGFPLVLVGIAIALTATGLVHLYP